MNLKKSTADIITIREEIITTLYTVIEKQPLIFYKHHIMIEEFLKDMNIIDYSLTADYIFNNMEQLKTLFLSYITEHAELLKKQEIIRIKNVNDIISCLETNINFIVEYKLKKDYADIDIITPGARTDIKLKYTRNFGILFAYLFNS